MDGTKTKVIVEVEERDAVAWVTLNRPERRNALNDDMFTALLQTFEALSLRATVRAVVLRGAGPAFCTGLDLKSLATLPAMNVMDQSVQNRCDLIRHIEKWQQAMSAVEHCPKPVIAAVHGHCIGGGLDLIAAADIRLASANALFSLREAAVAMVSDLGSLQRLPPIIGEGFTRELAYTARDVDASEALRMGLLNRIYDDQDQLKKGAAELAQRIAEQAPLAVQASKDVLNYSRNKSADDGMHYALVRNTALLPSDHLMEAMTAFLEKRAPVFK